MTLYGGITIPGQPDLENVRRLDLMPMKSIAEMQQYGIAIDRDRLRDISGKLEHELYDLRLKVCDYVPPEKLDEFIARSNMGAEDDYLPMNVDSNKQLTDLMFNVLGIGKDRQLKRTKSGDQISTGKRQLEQIKSEHPVVQNVLDYRERMKLKSTYADALPELAREHPAGSCWCGLKHHVKSWRIHTTVLTTRTATGRFASKWPNLQNLPIRSVHGRAIRACFEALAGFTFISVDFGQIELRMQAHLGRVSRMIQAFKDGVDIHMATAMAVFNEPDPDKIDKLTMRAPAKNCNFGIIYRETAHGLHEQLLSDTYGKSGIPVPEWLTEEWCQEFIDKWYGLYPEVLEYQQQQDNRAYRYGVVWDMFGRIRRVPEVKSVHKRVVESGLRQAGNMPIQGTAAELMKLAMCEVQVWIESTVRPAGIWCWPQMTIHDELLLETELEHAEVVAAGVVDIFERVLTDRQSGKDLCRVPIVADAKIGARWEK